MTDDATLTRAIDDASERIVLSAWQVKHDVLVATGYDRVDGVPCTLFWPLRDEPEAEASAQLSQLSQIELSDEMVELLRNDLLPKGPLVVRSISEQLRALRSKPVDADA